MKDTNQIPWHELGNRPGPKAATKFRESERDWDRERAAYRAKALRDELNHDAFKWLASPPIVAARKGTSNGANVPDRRGS